MSRDIVWLAERARTFNYYAKQMQDPVTADASLRSLPKIHLFEAMNGSEDLHRKIINLKLRCGFQKQVSTLNLWLELALTFHWYVAETGPKGRWDCGSEMRSPCFYPPGHRSWTIWRFWWRWGFPKWRWLRRGLGSWLAGRKMGRSWPSVSLQWMLLRSTGGSLSVTVV
jgi:hypothetical protein